MENISRTMMMETHLLTQNLVCCRRIPAAHFTKFRFQLAKRRSCVRSRTQVGVKAKDQSRDAQEEEQLRKVMQERVEDAAQILDDMIDDVVCELSAVQAISYVYNEIPESTESEIIRKVVKTFLKRLDQNFIASLERFEGKAADMGNKDVASLISKIHKEVMQQVKEEFPAEVLLLEDLMKIPDKQTRVDRIRQAYYIEEHPKKESTDNSQEEIEDDLNLDFGDLEGIPLDELDLKKELERLRILKTERGLKSLKEELENGSSKGLADNEPISDFDDVLNSMEDNPLEDCVPEEDSDVESMSKYGKKIDPVQVFMTANQFITDMEEKEEVANRSLLAKLCVIREEARLIELEMRYQGVQLPENPFQLRENVTSQAMGIIQACMKTSDPVKRVGLIRKTFEKDEYGPAAKDLNKAPGYVRPGMFMTALTMAQMEADTKSKSKATASQFTPEFLTRLDDVRLEAMLVLRDMAWGDFNAEELTQRQKARRKAEAEGKAESENETKSKT